MALEVDEVFDVVGDTFKNVATKLRDQETPGKITRQEAIQIAGKTIQDLIAEVAD